MAACASGWCSSCLSWSCPSCPLPSRRPPGFWASRTPGRGQPRSDRGRPGTASTHGPPPSSRAAGRSLARSSGAWTWRPRARWQPAGGQSRRGSGAEVLLPPGSRRRSPDRRRRARAPLAASGHRPQPRSPAVASGAVPAPRQAGPRRRPSPGGGPARGASGTILGRRMSRTPMLCWHNCGPWQIPIAPPTGEAAAATIGGRGRSAVTVASMTGQLSPQCI
mmetsp:Transcript_14325/g.44871  ORF Transcript_14325/g.44871 Transcript_14325/m.44871 type:complete len:221 (-) Transcript_14325:42-704(-)